MISTYHNGAASEANPDGRAYIPIVAPLGNAKPQEQTMRKPLLIVVTILMFFAFSAFAQDNPSSPSSASPSAQSGSQGTQPSSGSTGSMSQGSGQSSSNSSMSGGGANDQTIEGCIVKQETDYYIQPSSGGAPTKVSGSDVAAHVGHHVVVHGSQQSSSASNAANPSSGSSSSAASPSSGSSGDQTFNVTKVEMIATDCGSSKGNSGTSPDSANPK
jgi:hypothetical protein